MYIPPTVESRRQCVLGIINKRNDLQTYIKYLIGTGTEHAAVGRRVYRGLLRELAVKQTHVRLIILQEQSTHIIYTELIQLQSWNKRTKVYCEFLTSL